MSNKKIGLFIYLFFLLDCENFFLYFFRVDGEDVRLMLWDTAGQEEFDAITAAYYRGAHACVLAYSVTDRDSFDAIPSWKLKVNAPETQKLQLPSKVRFPFEF